MTSSGTSTGYAMLLAAVIAAGLGASPAAGQSPTQKAERDEIAMVANSDPVMAVAMRKARATLPDFLAAAAAPKPSMEGFAVKVAIPVSAHDAEYFWITPFSNDNGRFSGTINNTPRLAKIVKLGQTIAFRQSDIVDWMYMDGHIMKGNYTACALLKSASKRKSRSSGSVSGSTATFNSWLLVPHMPKIEKIEKNVAAPPVLSAPRKLSALAIRSFGYLIGTVLALFYLYLFIEVPPPDWQHMKPRTFMRLYCRPVGHSARNRLAVRLDRWAHRQKTAARLSVSIPMAHDLFGPSFARRSAFE